MSSVFKNKNNSEASGARTLMALKEPSMWIPSLPSLIYLAAIMVLIEKPPGLCFATSDAVVSLQFHGHSPSLHRHLNCEHGDRRIERLATAAGTFVKVWALSWYPLEWREKVSKNTEFNGSSAPPSESQLPSSTICGSVSKTNPGGCHISSRVVSVVKEHTPHYVVNCRFNPAGTILASCDSHTIVLSEFVRFVQGTEIDGISEEMWRVCNKITDPHSDIFDQCWHGDFKIITGSINGIKIWDINDQNLLESVKYSHGFVTGVASCSDQYIAAESNDKCIAVWKKNTSSTPKEKDQDTCQPAGFSFRQYNQIINDTDILALGPFDLPYYRRPSFDPTGRWVAFPYGERGNQCFGVVFSLVAPLNVPFRFRGHHLRVNCVAFSPVVFQDVNIETLKPLSVVGDTPSEISAVGHSMVGSTPLGFSSGRTVSTVVPENSTGASFEPSSGPASAGVLSDTNAPGSTVSGVVTSSTTLSRIVASTTASSGTMNSMVNVPSQAGSASGLCATTPFGVSTHTITGGMPSEHNASGRSAFGGCISGSTSSDAKVSGALSSAASTTFAGTSADEGLVGTNANSLLFTLYAQASVDGALSLWKVYYTTTCTISPECILILKPRFLDEQASVTDLAWAGDGITLAIGADDGSITLVCFTLEEIKGHPQCTENVTESLPSSSLPQFFATPNITSVSRPESLKGLNENEKGTVSDANKMVTLSRSAELRKAPPDKPRRRLAPTFVNSLPHEHNNKQ